MAFTPEDGTGVEDANAYGSVAGADAYFLDRGITTWTGTDGVKQSALIRATDYVEKRFKGQWRGTRGSQEQGLAWPRTYAYDVDGFLLEEVPLDLERAIYEYALRALTASLLPDPTVDATGRTVVSKREKVGPIEEETRYSESAVLDVLIHPYPAADLLLKGLTVGARRSIRA